MQTSLTGQLPTELVSHGVEFLEEARGAHSVREVFDAACDTVRRVAPLCCMQLWMVDEAKDCVCLAHANRSSEASSRHRDYPLRASHDSDVSRILFRHKERWDNRDAGFMKAEHLAGVGCPGTQGMAYLYLTTFDELRLLVSACVPSSLQGDFTFHREFFRMLGQGLVQAIERIRLMNERQLLSRIALSAVENQTRAKFFEKVAQDVRDTFKARGCSIFLYDKYRNMLVLGGTTGLVDPATNEPLLIADELEKLTYAQGEGLTGWVFKTGQTVRMFDACDSREWAAINPDFPVANGSTRSCKSAETPYSSGELRPFLCAPIFTDTHEFIGVIRLHGKKTADGKQGPACFLPSDERLLIAVSTVLARAIKRWDAEFEFRDSLQHQEALFDNLPRLLESDYDLRSALEIITEEARQLFQGVAASVLLKHPGEDRLVVECDNADRDRLPQKVSVPFNKGLCGYAATHRETVAVPNVARDSRFYGLDDIAPGALSDVKSEACTPIVFGNRLLGILNVDSDHVDCFHPDHPKLRMLEGLARQAAVVIHREVEREANLPIKGLLHHVADNFSTLLGVVTMLENSGNEEEEQITKLRQLCAELSSYYNQLDRIPLFDRPNVQPVFLNDLVERANWLIDSLIKGKSIEIVRKLHPEFSSKHPGSVRLEVDILLFHLILQNLISNAVEASPDGGTIELRTERLEEIPGFRNGGAALVVQDFGVGLSPENLRKVFVEPFTTKGGKGNGLRLVDRMAKAHGGVVLPPVSTAGRGATFSVVFPIIPA